MRAIALTLFALRDSSPSSNPLQRLHRLERSSPQFPDQLANILAGDEYKGYVSALRGEGLVWLIDYLDSVRLDITVPRSFLITSVGPRRSRSHRPFFSEVPSRAWKNLQQLGDITDIIHDPWCSFEYQH